MTEPQRIDQAVRELAGAVLAQHASVLAASGIRTTLELNRWVKDDAENCELRITFWRGNALVDVLEDFIIREGVAVASLAEFRRWLDQSVDAIVDESRDA